MTKRADSLLKYQQGSELEVVPDGFEVVTNPLSPQRRTADVMRHFDPDVYDVSSESHLSRLVKVILGDAGVGLLRKRNMVARLQSSVGGTHFLDLDRFWGAVFGLHRRAEELLDFDPYSETATDEQWDLAHIKDASYRARIMKFARAIHLGGTRDGIEAMAEAVLGIDVDVIETVAHKERWPRTWGDVAALGTWGDVAALGTWGQVATRVASPTESGGESRHHVVTIRPRGPITWEEVVDLERAIERIKPAGITVKIVQTPDEAFARVPIASAAADSENWELTAVDRAPGSKDLTPRQRFPWTTRSAEVWSHNESGPQAVAYFLDDDVTDSVRFDPLVEQTVPQVTDVDGVPTYTYPSDALMPVEQVLSGRSVSDGIIVASPYSSDRYLFDESGLTQQIVRAASEIGSDVMVDGTRLNEAKSSGLPAIPKFWVSPVRPANSRANEVLEIRFAQSVPVNRFSYQFSRFPCTVRLQAWIADEGRWQTISREENSKSVPYRIGNAGASGKGVHSGSGHWRQVRGSLSDAVSSSVFRFVLKRKDGRGPRSIDGSRSAYSLALRSINIGYQIVDFDSIPNQDIDTPLVTVTNSGGYTSQYFVRRSPASLVLDGLPTAWKSEPQPVREAVVSLYLDVRSRVGGAQGVDRVWIDPLTLGPTYNVYASSDEPPGLAQAASPDDPIVPTELFGSIISDASGLVWPDSKAYVEFDNGPLRFDHRGAWWNAIEFSPQWSSDESPGRTSVIWSAGPDEETALTDTSFIWRNTYFELRVGREVAQITPTREIVAGRPIRCFISYSPTAGPEIHIRHSDGHIDSNFTVSNVSAVGLVESVLGDLVLLTDSANITDAGLVVTNDGGTPWDSARIANYTLPSDIPLTLIIDLSLDEWQTGAARTLWSVDTGFSGGHVMKVDIDSTGRIAFSLSADGISYSTVTSDDVPTFIDGAAGKIQIDWDNATGATDFWSVSADGTKVSLGLTETLAVTPVSVASTFTVGGLVGSPANAISGIVRNVSILEGSAGFRVTSINFVIPSRLPEAIRIGSAIARTRISLGAFALGFGVRDPEYVLEHLPSHARRPTTGRGNTDGTILRYHPVYSGRRAPASGPCYGWMGGPPWIWDDLTWTPLLHSVALSRGYIDLPPTKAKFLKFEFSNLTAEPYETFLNVNKTVRVFPSSSSVAASSQDRSTTSLENTTEVIAGGSRFIDRPALTEVLEGTPVPTAAIVPVDAIDRAKMSGAGFAFQSLAWQPKSTMGVQATASKHQYAVMNLQHVNRVAFFVGIRSIKVGRFRPQSLSDARVYYESFVSLDDIASTTFSVDEGAMSTPTSPADSPMSTPCVATSTTFPSRSPIVGVQFATTQTPAFPLILDDTFRDPSLPYSDFTNAASWMPSGDATLVWDRALNRLRVSRDLSHLASVTPTDTPIVHPPVTPVFSVVRDADSSYSDDSYGGIKSPEFSPSPAGVLYLGARVSVEKDLATTLTMQLIGSDGTTVLASEEIDPRPFVETEVAMSYILGSTPGLESSMSLRVVQSGGQPGAWVMHALSAFDESVLWEFSNDGGTSWVPALVGRNSLDSIVTFPSGGNGLVWRVTAFRYNTIIGSIQMRPWYDRRVGAR